jgi:hypothetical protein
MAEGLTHTTLHPKIIGKVSGEESFILQLTPKLSGKIFEEGSFISQLFPDPFGESFQRRITCTH